MREGSSRKMFKFQGSTYSLGPNWGTWNDTVWHTLASSTSTGGTDSPSGQRCMLVVQCEDSGWYRISMDFTVSGWSFSGSYAGTGTSSSVNVYLHELTTGRAIGQAAAYNFTDGYRYVGSNCSYHGDREPFHIEDHVYLNKGVLYKFQAYKNSSTDGKLYSFVIGNQWDNAWASYPNTPFYHSGVILQAMFVGK